MDELIKFISEIKQAECRIFLKDKKVDIRIQEIKNWAPVEIKSSFCFVDGGNAPIFESPSLSVHLIRLAGILCCPNKKPSFIKKEFYSCVYANNDTYEIKTFPEQSFDFNIGFFEKELSINKNKVEIKRINPLIRRISELNFIRDNIEKADVFILDGSLETNFHKEKEILDKLKREMKEIYGFSKTTELTSGLPMNWEKGYCFLCKSDTNIFLIKLHKKSEHVFRIDSFKELDNELLNFLETNSKDPVFLGYPYGLIQADKLARVSNQEVEILKTKFMIKTGKNWKEFKKQLNSVNAHEVLDRIG